MGYYLKEEAGNNEGSPGSTGGDVKKCNAPPGFAGTIVDYPDAPPPLFNVGYTVATNSVTQHLGETPKIVHDLLTRHVAGDYGDICAEDAEKNGESIKAKLGSVMSVYRDVAPNVPTIWIITEIGMFDDVNAVTTVLFPEDY
tara:strand:- start:3872 stop:4297 length:426 start_codon:yes stop_codon:yes gene_type:complete